MAAVVCAVLLGGGYFVEADLDRDREISLELAEQSKTIQYYDEVLTMSARMAAFTGDTAWEKRYRIYEKKLDESLAILSDIMPLDKGRKGLKEIDKANIALIAMENRAFDFVRRGEKERAAALLFSPEYNAQKEIYTGAQEAVHEAEDEYVAHAEYLHDYFYLPLLSFAGMTGILFIAFSVYTGLGTREKLYAQEKLSIEYRRMAAVGNFSANIAHEINNALQPVLGLSEIVAKGLEKEESIDPRFAEYARIIYDSARHAREVVENVLTVARGSHSQVEKWEARALLREAVEFAAQILPPTISLRQDFSLENKGVTIVVNKTDVTRIITNLFKNAAEAMPEGGRIIAVTRMGTVPASMAKIHDMTPGDCVVLSISDTGQGMDAKTLASVFEPFFTTKQDTQGTGLGLSMAFGIMKQYGGTITVDSKPGRGATFHLYFPVVRA